MGYLTVELEHDELACINEMFDQEEELTKLSETVALKGTIPAALVDILHSGKFTLLGEVKNYRLWFPLKFNTTTDGSLQPVLGTPEVMEAGIADRSWRLRNIKDIHVQLCHLDIDGIASLSNTGMALTLPSSEAQALMKSPMTLTMTLPNQSLPITLRVRPIRYEQGVLALQFQHPENSTLLKDYLFERHRDKYPGLYQDLQLQDARLRPE